MVLFHVNTGTVARIPADKNFATAHGVPQCIPGISVNDYFPAVHCVAHCILCISMNNNGSAIQIRPQGIARCTLDGDGLFFETTTNKTLTIAILDKNITRCGFYLFIQLFEIKVSCSYYHKAAPPNTWFRTSRAKAISPGFSHISGKSMESSGVT